MRLQQFQTSSYSDQPHLLLLGHPVAHSLSPLMHNTAAEYYGLDVRYHAVDLEPDELGSMAARFNSELFRGANITVPYKERMMDFVDELDGDAQSIGAINTIVPGAHRLTGYNTDIYGFMHPLEPYGGALDGCRALIFGTGGAARAVVHGLMEAGAVELLLVSRSPGRITSYNHLDRVRVIGYEEWTAYADESALVVNATPMGMEPNTDTAPVRKEEKQSLSDKICYDIVYKPQKTRFLRLAEEAGAMAVIGGLEMLIQQGSKSFELWTGKPFPVELIRQTIHEQLS